MYTKIVSLYIPFIDIFLLGYIFYLFLSIRLLQYICPFIIKVYCSYTCFGKQIKGCSTRWYFMYFNTCWFNYKMQVFRSGMSSIIHFLPTWVLCPSWEVSFFLTFHFPSNLLFLPILTFPSLPFLPSPSSLSYISNSLLLLQYTSCTSYRS